MYGLPSYGEVDRPPSSPSPTPSSTASCSATWGRALILSLVGYLMARMKKMELGKILIRCGFSAAFFGLVFGSVFGFEHALDRLYPPCSACRKSP